MLPFRILILSKNKLPDESLDTIYEWFYTWGAHPMCRPSGQIHISEIALEQDGVVYDWARWRDRIQYHWLVVIGAETARYLKSLDPEGRIAKYGYPTTLLPDPSKVPHLEPRYHIILEDFVQEIFGWARLP